MRSEIRTVHSMVVSLAIFAVFSVGPARAAASAQAGFGSHVAECAQTHEFDGEHNPGIHQAWSGWPGTTC